MKRVICIILMATLLVTALASPVSAADITNDIGFEVLDYTTVNGSGTNFFYFKDSTQIHLTLPERYYSSYIDILFIADGPTPTSVQNVWGSTINELTILHIGERMYRAYGNIRHDAYSNLYLNFITGSSSTVFIEIKSVVLRNGWVHYDTDAYCSISSYGFNDVIHYVSTDDINHRQLPAVTNYAYAGYQLSIWTENWRKYDYVDYNLYLLVDSITSISCYINGDTVVPFTVSYIDNDSMTVNSYAITIRVDLTGINRNLDSNPVVIIEGNQFTVGVETASSWIYFNGCSGFVDTNSDYTWYRDLKANLSDWLSPLVGLLEDFMTNVSNNFALLWSNLDSHFSDLGSWMTTLNKSVSDWGRWLKQSVDAFNTNVGVWFDELESAVRGDTAPGDAFQDEVDEKDQQLNDMAAVMDSVEKPSLDSINVNVNQYVAPADIAVLTSPLLVFLTGDIFGPIIIMTLILATVSYVLYGKR